MLQLHIPLAIYRSDIDDWQNDSTCITQMNYAYCWITFHSNVNRLIEKTRPQICVNDHDRYEKLSALPAIKRWKSAIKVIISGENVRSKE